MVNLTNEALARELKINGNQCNNVIKGKGYKIYRNYQLEAETVDIISFSNGVNTIIEKKDRKIYYIYLNEYILSLQSVSADDEQTLSFRHAVLYRKKDGMAVNVELSGTFDINHCVVIEHRLIAIVSENRPYFLAVSRNNLAILPALSAEQILRGLNMSTREQKALIEADKDGNWSLENGLLLNPLTLETPSILLHSLKRKHLPKTLKTYMMFQNLRRLLTGKGKNAEKAIHYINSDGI